MVPACVAGGYLARRNGAGLVTSSVVSNIPHGVDGDFLVRRYFAFVDLCGFTAVTDEEGVEQAVVALSTFRAVVREQAGWRGVRVAKWLGDGVMLVATEARPLVDAVLRMEQALDQRGCTLPVHGGMAAGRVILFEGDDYVGRAVNLAARLCDQAEPHQILITKSLYETAGEGLPGKPLGPTSVMGFTRPVEVVDLTAGRWTHEDAADLA
jgi:adenylate cyclase